MPVKLMELHQTKGRNYDSKEWGKERLGAKIIISGKKTNGTFTNSFYPG
jgi:hypothetical protein